MMPTENMGKIGGRYASVCSPDSVAFGNFVDNYSCYYDISAVGKLHITW